MLKCEISLLFMQIVFSEVKMHVTNYILEHILHSMTHSRAGTERKEPKGYNFIAAATMLRQHNLIKLH